jgi:hypothetical protein
MIMGLWKVIAIGVMIFLIAYAFMYFIYNDENDE